jgi:hypothetical protein
LYVNTTNKDLKTYGKKESDMEKELKKYLKTSDFNYNANEEFYKDAKKLVMN